MRRTVFKTGWNFFAVERDWARVDATEGFIGAMYFLRLPEYGVIDPLPPIKFGALLMFHIGSFLHFPGVSLQMVNAKGDVRVIPLFPWIRLKWYV